MLSSGVVLVVRRGITKCKFLVFDLCKCWNDALVNRSLVFDSDHHFFMVSETWSSAHDEGFCKLHWGLGIAVYSFHTLRPRNYEGALTCRFLKSLAPVKYRTNLEQNG